MADFPYTPNPPNIGKFLDHIQDSGVPKKVTNRHLESVGFKSKNDRYLIAVLKDINFLDSNGVPTEAWQAYKDRGKSKAILADELRGLYSDLFTIYPDAYRKDDEALNNYFASKTGLAKATVERIARTFKVLCDRAELEGTSSASSPATPKEVPPLQEEPAPAPAPPAQQAAPTIAINIQLELPATDNAEIYENLFKAMKKHLFS